MSLTKHRRGEAHFRAKLTDAEVRDMRKRHNQEGWGYGRCARAFNCGVSTARDIITYRTRNSA